MDEVIEAARKGDVTTLEKLFKASNDFFQKYTPGKILAIHYIAAAEKPDALLWAIGNGANLRVADELGWPPLLYAADAGRIENCRVLMKHGVLPTSGEHRGITGLHRAAVRGNLPLVKMFVEEFEVPVDLLTKPTMRQDRPLPVKTKSLPTSPSGNSALHFAFEGGWATVATWLLEQKADGSLPYQAGASTLLHLGARNPGLLAPFRLLVANSSDPPIEANETDTATSASAGDSKATEQSTLATRFSSASPILPTKAAAVREKWHNGPKPSTGKPHVNFRATNGLTPLHEACTRGNIEAARVLIERKADVTLLNHRRETCLHLACERNHLAVAKLLLDKGLSVLAVDATGATSLHSATTGCSVPTIQFLVNEAKISVDVVDTSKTTALMVASQATQEETVQCLLELKANAALVDSQGRSAMCLAVEARQYHIAALMVLQGVPIDPALIQTWTSGKLNSYAANAFGKDQSGLAQRSIKRAQNQLLVKKVIVAAKELSDILHPRLWDIVVSYYSITETSLTEWVFDWS